MKHFVYKTILLLLFPLIWGNGEVMNTQKKRQVNLPKEMTLPTVRFNSDNPFDEVNKRTKGTPWQPVDNQPLDLPEEIKALVPEPIPDVKKLSEIEYRSAVSMAFESMRIVYGELTEEQAQEFCKMWAPLFGYPAQNVIDYLNKLNPLLTQFIVARESMGETITDVELLLEDANSALAWDDLSTYNQIVSEASLLSKHIKRLHAGMKELANRIEALGNPPNPLEEMARVRRLHNMGFPKKEIPFPGEAWLGVRERDELCVNSLPSLQEPLLRHLFKAKVGAEEQYFVIELSEKGVPTKDELEKDSNLLKNIKVVQRFYGMDEDERPRFKADAKFHKYLPNPPKLLITTTTMKLLTAFNMSDNYEQVMKENPSLGEDILTYHNTAGNYGNRMLRGGFFFKVATDWAYNGKWNQYEIAANGYLPQESLRDFEKDLRKEIMDHEELQRKSRKERKAAMEAEAAQAPPVTPEQIRQRQVQDSLAMEKKAKEESIAWREEYIRSLEQEIQREEEYRSRAMDNLMRATSADDKRRLYAEIEDIDRRIMNRTANIQFERNEINNMRTGEFNLVRTVYDDYAFAKTIQSCKEEAARNRMVKRAIPTIEKQIERLPKNERDAARERFERLYESVNPYEKEGSDKIRKFSNALNETLTAYALKEQAKQEEVVVDHDEYELIANSTIMVCGSITGGIAAASYKAPSAAFWASKLYGMAYAGVTGYIAGGASQGAKAAASSFNPVVSYVYTYVDAYAELSKSCNDENELHARALEAANTDALINIGTGILGSWTEKLCRAYGPKFLTKPLFVKPNNNLKVDIKRTKMQINQAKEDLKSFKQMNLEYDQMVAAGASKAELNAKMAVIENMTAKINANYHHKWFLKYKADNQDKIVFNKSLERVYNKMIPEMTSELKGMGYHMDDMKLQQFRNASSAGSVGMDLDLAPISKITGREPVYIRNGVQVSAAEFMRDAQQVMNRVYFKQQGFSARASEMNFVNSAHPEAFSNPDMVKANVDLTRFSADDIASIGKVLKVKADGIENNSRMTLTTQLQAKSREADKEIRNMLLPLLNQRKNDAIERYKLAEGNKFQKKSVMREINDLSRSILYWEKIEKHLNTIGTKTSSPEEIHKLDIAIRKDSGGRNIHQVVNQLIDSFNPYWKQNPETRVYK